MRKFTDISDKRSSLDFKKDKPGNTSNDIESLNNQLLDEVDGTKLDGSWEIVSVVDVSTELPNIKEALVINAELGNTEIKRGDVIYITAQIKKKDQNPSYNQVKMGVIKVRVVDIYNTLTVLNSLK